MKTTHPTSKPTSTTLDNAAVTTAMNLTLDAIAHSALDLAIITLHNPAGMTDAQRVHMIYDTIRQGEQLARATMRQLDKVSNFTMGYPLHDNSNVC